MRFAGSLPDGWSGLSLGRYCGYQRENTGDGCSDNQFKGALMHVFSVLGDRETSEESYFLEISNLI